MKHKIITIIFICSLAALQSCLLPSKDYLFENTEQTIVIEGRLVADLLVQKVLVSKSVYGENVTDNEFVNDAVVRVVNEETEHEELLDFIGKGQYVSSEIVPKLGEKYRLEVEVEGGLYTATEMVTAQPQVTHVFATYRNTLPYDEGYYLFFNIQKNLDSTAYYKIEVAINGQPKNNYSDLWVFDDHLFTENQLLMLPYKLNNYDTILMNVFALSNNMYEYYQALSKQTTNLYSNIQPPQINPPNNLSNSVLGYFQVSSVYQLDTVLQLNLER